jgi:acetyl esterase/lipase
VVTLAGPTNFLTMDAQAGDPGGCPSGPQIHDAADSPESKWLGAGIQSVQAKAWAANPMTYLLRARSLPRFVIAHGAQDCLVPHGQSLELLAALKKRGAKVTFELQEGAGHDGEGFNAPYRPALPVIKSTVGSPDLS